MWQRLQKGIHRFILYNGHEQFEGLGECNYQVDPQTGWKSYPSKSQRNLRHPTSSSSSTQWDKARRLEIEQKLEFLAILILEWMNSSDFFWVQRSFFACRKFEFLTIDGCVDRYTCRTPHFHMYSRCHSTDDMCSLAQGAWGLKTNCVPKNIHSSTHHVSPCASQHTGHQHKFSLTYLSCVTRRPLLRTQTCCPHIHLSTVKILGKMVLLQNSTPPQFLCQYLSLPSSRLSFHTVNRVSPWSICVDFPTIHQRFVLARHPDLF